MDALTTTVMEVLTVTGPRPVVRPRYRDADVEGVEDLRAAALPTWAAEVAR